MDTFKPCLSSNALVLLLSLVLLQSNSVYPIDVIRASIGASTLIETGPDTYAIILPKLRTISSEFVVVHDDVLETVRLDCSRSTIKLDGSKAALHNSLEVARRSYEKGALNVAVPRLSIIRAIYASDRAIRSTIKMGPVISDGHFTLNDLDVHQTDDDFTFAPIEKRNDVSRTFLIRDTLIHVHDDGHIDLNPIRCLVDQELADVMKLQQRLREASSIFHECIDKFLAEIKEVAAVYRKKLEDIKSSSASESADSTLRTNEAKAEYDVGRERLLAVKDNCLKSLKSLS